MPTGAEISSVERNFILEALRQGVRLDGRPLDQLRPIRLDLGEEYGAATVDLGRTRVFVQVSAEVTKPLDDRKFDGVFNIVTELSPIASPAFEVGRYVAASGESKRETDVESTGRQNRKSYSRESLRKLSDDREQ